MEDFILYEANKYTDNKKYNTILPVSWNDVKQAYIDGITEFLKMMDIHMIPGIKTSDLQLIIDKKTDRKKLLIPEDRLPDLSNEDWTKWYERSNVIFGIRMGEPYIIDKI